MSHFTVLVVAENEQELEARLLPYHEYECTGITEYTEFVPTDLSEAAEKLKENNERWAESEHPEWVYDTLDAFIPGYYGSEKNSEGVWGRVTNPNAKWDWWVVGGRWSGLLQLKNGKTANICKIGEIDTEAMVRKNIEAARKQHRAWKNKPEVPDSGYLIDNGIFFLDKDEAFDLETMTEEAYVEKEGKLTALTYALLDAEGRWNARGEMGWWGMDSNKDFDYDVKFWEYLNSLDPDTNVYVVDCHI